jgi:hypothetical protein
VGFRIPPASPRRIPPGLAGERKAAYASDPICFKRKRPQRPNPVEALRGGSVGGDARARAPQSFSQRGVPSKLAREARSVGVRVLRVPPPMR